MLGTWSGMRGCLRECLVGAHDIVGHDDGAVVGGNVFLGVAHAGRLEDHYVQSSHQRV